MNRHSRRFSPTCISLLLVCSLLAGCASTAPPPPNSLSAAIPASFKEQPATAAEPRTESTESAWWTVYADPTLDALVEQANRGNTSIAAARARLAYRQAAARQTGAARSPQLGLSAGISRLEGPLVNAAGQDGTLITASATLSYEVDVLGRLAQTNDAAALDAQGQQALLRSAQLLTQAQVVQTYHAIRALDEELDLVRQSLQSERETLRIAQYRFQSGASSELAYEQQRASHEALDAEASTLERRRFEQESALAVLLGVAASDFHLAPAPWVSKLPTIRAGLPATVLGRRPDVASAQKSVQAAQKRLGAAQSAWLPNLTLTSTGGYASPELSNLFTAPMQTLAIGALAAFPLFDGGRREAGVAMADAELGSASASYREHVLNALKEVEDQLAATRLLAAQSDALTRAQSSATRASALSASRYRSGLISQLDLLEAQRRELQTRRNTLQVRASQYQASVALVRAIGGGWD